MSSKRFLQSFNFILQHRLVWYSRVPLVDTYVDKLENRTAKIINCPDEDRSYTEYNKCRVYFKNDVLLDIKFV